jgi:hypothetical protein
MEALPLLAHGIVGRQDLPIPRWLFGWAAAAVLVVSFVGLAVLWTRPRLERAAERRLLRVPVALEVLAGAIGVALFALVVYAGLVGSQVQTANLAPTFVYVVFWVGLVPLSVLFGDVFAALSPWRAIGRAAGWVAGRVGGASLPEPLPYPERLGRWPAVVGLLAFAWVELVWGEGSDPSTLALLALAYAAAMLVGMSLFGVEAWTRNGDAFAAWFGVFASLAPLRWQDRTAYLRAPLSGAARWVGPAGSVAFLCAMIGTTTFDGFSEGPTWSAIVPELTELLAGVLGISQAAALELAFTLGLLAVVVLVGLLYLLGCAGMRSVERVHTTHELARAFAHSLAPIALAYVVAHYFSLLAYQGQAVAYLASNPLGETLAPGDGGIFGTAQARIDYTFLGANAIWYVQVAALVLGHVAGLVLAHDRALVAFRRTREATRSQYWMLAVMVAFTSLGLWLLSAANA